HRTKTCSADPRAPLAPGLRSSSYRRPALGSGRGAVSTHAAEVHHEDQGLSGADHSPGTPRPIAEVGWDGQPTAPADQHAGHALVPSGDHVSRPEREGEELAAAPGRIELLTTGPRHPDVVDVDSHADNRFGPVADLEVLDH